MPNALIHQTSPYLLQHAYNPVQWLPWGQAAFDLAKQQHKPILLSIGYAACHWCHVMEHESFMNEATASIMNAHFICIKVDREERPDVDHIYMDALQAMTGQGGWPLNIFLTPELQPFYGGTYFPPTAMHNRASFTTVLQSIQQAWQQRKHEIEAQAYELTQYLIKQNSFGTSTVAHEYNAALLHTIATTMLSTADAALGGFGAAPKFLQLHTITYLLRHYHYTQHKPSLSQATLSLTTMLRGGIYDQLRGGMARYSTTNDWLVPHFEKMLYDNALLIQALSEAYSITQVHIYKTAIADTIAFITQDLTHSNGLYYAALDADSEGIEGKYYCYTHTEIHQLLAPLQAQLCCTYFGITEQGNWVEPHHNITTNILHCTMSVAAAAALCNITEEQATELLRTATALLLNHRYTRVPPLTDCKCLLSWNALMSKALVAAYKATGNSLYLQQAVQHFSTMLQVYVVVENNAITHMYHCYTSNVVSITALLDDVAYLANAALQLYHVTLKQSYQDVLMQLITYAQAHYASSTTPYYYYTQATEPHIIVRKKEIYDGATPSGNSIMAYVLAQAGILCNIAEYTTQSNAMLTGIHNVIIKQPNSFAVWATAIQQCTVGINEVTVPKQGIQAVHKAYIPNTVYKVGTNDTYMLCKHNTCYAPVATLHQLLQSIAAHYPV